MGRHFYGDVIFSRLLSGYFTQHARPAVAKECQISTRARVRLFFSCFFERAGGQASPPVEEAWPSARARAKYKPQLQKNHFFVSKLKK